MNWRLAVPCVLLLASACSESPADEGSEDALAIGEFRAGVPGVGSTFGQAYSETGTETIDLRADSEAPTQIDLMLLFGVSVITEGTYDVGDLGADDAAVAVSAPALSAWANDGTITITKVTEDVIEGQLSITTSANEDGPGRTANASFRAQRVD